MADPLNAMTETNESNNLAALPLTVTQALVSREQTAGYTVSVAMRREFIITESRPVRNSMYTVRTWPARLA